MNSSLEDQMSAPAADTDIPTQPLSGLDEHGRAVADPAIDGFPTSVAVHSGDNDWASAAPEHKQMTPMTPTTSRRRRTVREHTSTEPTVPWC
jgi:hypothetical protein